MKKILVVDDQSGWRNFNTGAVKEILGKDIILHTASSGKDGYDKILENLKEPYDFIITDMQMETDYSPLMAGEWLIEQIKNLSSYYKTKIIIISASPKIKQIAQTYEVDYIPKSSAIVSLDFYKQILTPDL